MPDYSAYADDQQLARYLLGLLPDEETERLDEVTLVDDGVAARLRLVENDLVDAYVSGTLAGEMLDRFESRYLASPRRRDQVEFAGEFLRAVDRKAGNGGEALAAVQPRNGIIQAVDAPAGTRKARRWSTNFRLLAIAATLVAVCGMMLFESMQLRDRARTAERESAAATERARSLEKQLGEQRAANAADATAAKELSRVRESAAAGASQFATAALMLLPQTRAAGPIPAIALSPATDTVRFELQLDASDFPRYEPTLVDPASNQIVWRGGLVTPVTSGGATVVPVAVPARSLKAQHYTIALTGHTAATGPEVVASYTFQIVRR